jgi:hypothetical protein
LYNELDLNGDGKINLFDYTTLKDSHAAKLDDGLWILTAMPSRDDFINNNTAAIPTCFDSHGHFTGEGVSLVFYTNIITESMLNAALEWNNLDK